MEAETKYSIWDFWTDIQRGFLFPLAESYNPKSKLDILAWETLRENSPQIYHFIPAISFGDRLYKIPFCVDINVKIFTISQIVEKKYLEKFARAVFITHLMIKNIIKNQLHK